MNKVLTLGLVAAGIIIYTGAKKAKGATKLQFYPDSVDFSHMTLTNWTAYLKIEVVNPTKTKQTINSIFANIYAGNTQVGRIQQTTPQEISKLGSSFIVIPIKITATGAGYLLAQLLKADMPPITVKGTILSMGINIPFEEQLS